MRKKKRQNKNFLNRLLDRIQFLSFLSTKQARSFLPEEYPALTFQILNSSPKVLEWSQAQIKNTMLQKNNCFHNGYMREFNNRAFLRKHLRVHSPWDHGCAECGKAFKESTELKSHFLVHTEVKPFTCTLEWCGKTFSLSNLCTHVLGRTFCVSAWRLLQIYSMK